MESLDALAGRMRTADINGCTDASLDGGTKSAG